MPNWFVSAWPAVRPLVTHGLIGAITYFFTARYFKKQKWHEFDQRRLEEFYGPMLGFIKQIGANRKTRMNVSQACDEAWREICAQHQKPFDHDKYFQPFERALEYENERFKKGDLVAYDEMLELFRMKNYLAYHSTLHWFDQFSQYVDHWHRPMPRQVLMKLNISEGPLFEFYKDVETHCNKLRVKLSGDRSAERRHA